jgi:hypothetical protein
MSDVLRLSRLKSITGPKLLSNDDSLDVLIRRTESNFASVALQSIAHPSPQADSIPFELDSMTDIIQENSSKSEILGMLMSRRYDIPSTTPCQDFGRTVSVTSIREAYRRRKVEVRDDDYIL